jgi:hypothetical protein
MHTLLLEFVLNAQIAYLAPSVTTVTHPHTLLLLLWVKRHNPLSFSFVV